MYFSDLDIEVVPVTSIKITIGDQECLIPSHVWEIATSSLSVVKDYTRCKGVDKIKAIRMIRDATGSSLREAKIMVEAYFLPKMAESPEFGWLDRH